MALYIEEKLGSGLGQCAEEKLSLRKGAGNERMKGARNCRNGLFGKKDI